MSSAVYFIYVVSVNEESLVDFKKLADEAVEATRKEPGTRTYHWSTNDGGRTIHMFELYEDSAAFVKHVQQTFGGLAGRMELLACMTSVTVYGNPDAAARKIMDGWSAIYMAPFVGFVDRG